VQTLSSSLQMRGPSSKLAWTSYRRIGLVAWIS
jgi:hypothetical protein